MEWFAETLFFVSSLYALGCEMQLSLWDRCGVDRGLRTCNRHGYVVGADAGYRMPGSWSSGVSPPNETGPGREFWPSF